jgi:DNA replication protein DnaC
MIEKLVGNIPEINPDEDSYYIGEDSLKHCTVCNEPIEIKIHWPWGDKTESCMCKCRTEAYHADMAALKTDETGLQIMRYTDINRRLNPSISDMTFEKDNGSQPKLSFCREYAKNFEDKLKRGSGLILLGPCGTGKSFGAACILNSVLNQGYRALMISIEKIAEQAEEAGFEGKGEYFDDLMNIPLLILDDLGTARETEYMMEITNRVISDRDKSMKPLIVTTNIPYEDIKNPRNDDWARIWSRINSRSIPINFSGTDKRSESAARLRDETRKQIEIYTQDVHISTRMDESEGVI